MTAPLDNTADYEPVWRRYQENFPRHLMGVSRHLHAQVMQALSGTYGHTQLRLSYEPYIALIGTAGAKLSDIADSLGISRQAANQTANQIEAAGYIRRVTHPTDGRAKLAVLTARGETLRRDGAELASSHQRQLLDIVGASAIDDSSRALFRFCQSRELLDAQQTGVQPAAAQALITLLPRVSDYINQRLMTLTMQRGHPDLRPHFGQVLAFIAPHGGRIQPIADINKVSKQAISAIATELEQLGYIYRRVDSRDARQVALLYSEAGRKLIADSVAAIDDLEQEFAAALGAASLRDLKATFATLYRALHLEEHIFGSASTGDIRAIARDLQQQLGAQGARALGELLCASNARET